MKISYKMLIFSSLWKMQPAKNFTSFGTSVARYPDLAGLSRLLNMYPGRQLWCPIIQIFHGWSRFYPDFIFSVPQKGHHFKIWREILQFCHLKFYVPQDFYPKNFSFTPRNDFQIFSRFYFCLFQIFKKMTWQRCLRQISQAKIYAFSLVKFFTSLGTVNYA